MEIVLNDVYNMDCIEGMKLLKDESVDLVISDPPYAIDFDKPSGSYARNEENVIPGYVEIPREEYFDFSKKWLAEVFRVLKPSGSLYLISGYTNASMVEQAIKESGFIIENYLAWEHNFAPHATKRFVNNMVPIFFASKNSKKKTFFPYAYYSKEERDDDDKKLHHKHRGGVWKVEKEFWIKKLKTPNKLPLKLIEKMLNYSSKDGDVILDPFGGSGQISYCCKMMGRQFISFEVVERYCDFARARINRNQYYIDPGEDF